jgi:sulfatase maturation enzyme AslB (radical SAM superfamily)
LISTNGSARPLVWHELAKLDVNVIFCIDGLANTHELYRRQTDWQTVINHAQSFISAGGCATWKMILFDHNQTEIEQCRTLSQELGFNQFLVVDHDRSDFPVFDQKKTYLYSIGQPTHSTNFKELYNTYLDSTINGYVEPIKAESIQCQASKKKSIYITATGEVYPCCWLGFYPRTMWATGNSQVIPLLPANNNANQTSIESSMQWVDQVEKSWASEPLVQCKINCGVKLDNQ